jgi:hypothetical protein
VIEPAHPESLPKAKENPSPPYDRQRMGNVVIVMISEKPVAIGNK